MENKINFSICLIARNESKTLPKMLASLSEFQARGGEILLLDTGSTDETAKVARNLGCIVHEVGEKFIITLDKKITDKLNEKFSWWEGEIVKPGAKLFDYSAARNYIAGFAKNDMIAMPDCDEAFTKFDIDKINEAIEGGADQLEYNFVFSHDADGKDLIKFMHSKFYNRKKMNWVGVIHEILQGSVNPKFLDESIIKLEHWQNPETNRGHYLPGLLYDCYKNPENDRNAHYLGRELMYAGKYPSAIKQFERHIEMKRWPTEASESMAFIGDCYQFQGNRDGAIAAYTKSFDMEPRRREPLMKLAELYYKEGKPEQVIAYCCAALQIAPGNFYANYAPFYEYYPHEMLYWALWQKGEIISSRIHFEICLAYKPFDTKYLADMRHYHDMPKLSFVIPTMGRPEGLKRCIDSIKALNYPQEKVEIIVIYDDKKSDFEGESYKDGEKDLIILANNGRSGVPLSLKKGVEKSTGDWIVYASNDIEFHPNSIMCALKTAMDNNKSFMAFNTGVVSEDEGNICEHFMIHKKLIPMIGGEIFDTEFNHVGVDNLLWAKLKKIRQAMRCERAIVAHKHFSKTGEEMDSVSKIGWNEESVKEDRELLAKKLLELEQEEPVKVI